MNLTDIILAKKKATRANTGITNVSESTSAVAEGAELKQAKRKYNQAAKDANADQVGAGKKIDTMKKSLRQKDVDNKKDVVEGVAETLPMADAVKVLRHYGADHFKTTSNELHFYKQGRPFSVDLVLNRDATRSVTLSSLNSAARGLKSQGVAEGQLNEYLVKAGMPVKDVLALNLFQDFDPVEGAAAQFPEFAQEPMWKQVVRKYAPIANMLKKKLLATKRPLTDAEAEAVEETWYDGSDAYDDMEIEYLVDIYNQQIDTLEALLAGNLTDEEFGEGVAEGGYPEVDHMPGPVTKRTQTGCKRCHGKGYVYKTPDGETHPMNRPDAKKYKCGKCDGIGFVKVVEQGVAEGLWDRHQSIPELEQAIENLIMGYKGGTNLTDKGRAQLLMSINKGKRILAKKKQQQGVAEGIDPRNYDSDEDYYNDLYGDDEDLDHSGSDDGDSGYDDTQEPEAHYEKHLRVNRLESVAEGFAEHNPVVQAITRRILLQRHDLLAKYGPEKVGAAIDEVGDYVGDVEEIGSSDVSSWVKHVEQMLGNMGESVTENAEQLNVGDPVIITGNVQFNGTTGEISEFSRDNRFVIVNLYNHGKHSFHSSDVSYNDYADSDEEEAHAYDNDPQARDHMHGVTEDQWSDGRGQWTGSDNQWSGGMEEGYSDEEHPIKDDGPVEAYGYAYNKRDQRVMWRKVFSSGEAAYKWADNKNATVMGTRPVRQEMSELSNELLGRYKKELGVRSSAADKAGDYDKGHEYYKKITKATLRQGENDARKHAKTNEDIVESRLYQMKLAGYDL